MPTTQLPPGPQASPMMQTVQWLKDPLAFMETCRQQYGDIFTVKIGPLFSPQVFVSHPRAHSRGFCHSIPKTSIQGQRQVFAHRY